MHSREPDELISNIQMRHTQPEVRTVAATMSGHFIYKINHQFGFLHRSVSHIIYLHITTFVKEYYNVRVRLLFIPRLFFM